MVAVSVIAVILSKVFVIIYTRVTPSVLTAQQVALILKSACSIVL